MIALNNTRSLEIILAGAITTNQLPWTATYADHDPAVPSFTATPADGATNNTTSVTMVSAPAAGIQRTIKRLNVYNADTAQATVTIRVNNSGTLRTQFSIVLQTGERIEYEDGKGFSVYTVTGAQKVTAVQSTVEPGYIDGLILKYVGTNALTVTTGSAYIPSVGANVNLTADFAFVGMTLSASTWYHLYLFLNSGVPSVEFVTTAPSATYNGWARTKNGDTTRRYIGSFRTNGSSQIIQFKVDTSGAFRYLTNNASQRILSAGTATVRTTVSGSNYIPVTATHAILVAANTDTAIFWNLSQPEAVATSIVGISPNSPGNILTFPCSDSQQVEYFYSGPPTGSAFLDVVGFYAGR